MSDKKDTNLAQEGGNLSEDRDAAHKDKFFDERESEEIQGPVVGQAEEVFQFEDSRKLGITSSVFLILNKMIGTGSK